MATLVLKHVHILTLVIANEEPGYNIYKLILISKWLLILLMRISANLVKKNSMNASEDDWEIKFTPEGCQTCF